MRLYLTSALLAVFLLVAQTNAEGGWSWGEDDKKMDAPVEIKKDIEDEPISAESAIVERSAVANNTDIDEVVDSILDSSRQGRNIQGYDEIYSDPSIQEVLQKGDDTDARNMIKDRLCSLGLMQCDNDSGYISPEELVYAQPVDIKPIGRPIASIPVKNPSRAYYGPAKPVPYPNKNGPPHHGPPRRYGPPPSKPYFAPPHSKPFGPPPGYNGPEISRPPPGFNGIELSRPPPGYNGPELSRPPPGFNEHSRPPFIEPEIPYEFEHGSSSSSGSFYQNKDTIKKRPIAVTNGVDDIQQHVHHHFHHNSEADGASNKVPTVIVNNPVPIATGTLGLFKPSEQLSGSGFNTGSNSFNTGSNSFNTQSSFGGSNGFKGQSQFGSAGLTIGGSGINDQFKTQANYASPGLTIGGSTLGGSYGGQSIAHYGSSGGSSSNGGLSNFATKPVVENFGPQQFGSSSASSSLYGNSFGSQAGSQLGYGNGNTYGGNSQGSYGNGNSFGASVGSYGNSDFYKKELNVNSGLQSNHLTGYGEKFQGVESSRSENYDCVCVPFDQCPSQDVIGRKDDIYLALDPRNLKTDIQAEEERVITDGNGNMTLVRVAKATGLNGTSESNTTEEIKKISKREAPVDKTESPSKAKVEARQSQNDNNKNIKPTFGVSFGLPQQGGYPVNPLDHHNPLVNPYGGYGASNGINLGLVSVNPLVSVQVTKDDYGDKVIKPFVNLHVTPNDFLVHKFADFFAYKKHALFNKHQHYHQHSYRPHHQHPHYDGPGPHYEQGPSFNRPGFYDGPYPYREGSDFLGPQFNPSYQEPNFNQPGYGDESNFGGGYGLDDGFYGRSFPNDTSNNNLLNQFNRQLENGQNSYSSSYNKYINFNDNQQQNAYDSYGNPTKAYSAYDISRRGKSLGIKTKNIVKFPNNRRRRDVTDEPEVKSKIENRSNVIKRQAYYGNQNSLNTCGPRHVCCRRPMRPQIPIPSPNNRQCGIRHSQGINGRIKNPVYVDGDSEFGEYPWQVAILKKDPKESVYVCGGTLIDPLHIITAAHCVKTYTPYDLRVRLGEWDVNHDVEFFPYVERDITVLTVHPEFYAGTLYNDIAVLRMDKPVDFTKYPHILPACLPSPHDDYTGTRCWTTGWGKDAFGDFGKYQNILKEVDVPIMNQGECQQRLQHTRLGYDFKLHPGFVCAGGEEGKDACKGDGGGPMVCERGGSMQIVGVVSWGIGCGQTGVPGVYVKVSHYLDWIRQITQRF